MAREHVKKSVRFEVFKRDSFTCQYCGQKAPEVVLEIDHIHPVADGGGSEILNLVTACRGCNSGKSDKVLSDTAALDKQRAQLEDLQERRQQLEMLHQWHMSLVDLDEQAVSMAGSLWFESVGMPDYVLSEAGAGEMRTLIKRHGFDRVCEAIKEAAESALKSTAPIEEAQRAAFWKIGKFLSVMKIREEDPGRARLFYIRGILRNRLNKCIDWKCMELLTEAYEAGVTTESMEWLAKGSSTWSSWQVHMVHWIEAAQTNNSEDESNGQV
jgi:hypothetical protein